MKKKRRQLTTEALRRQLTDSILSLVQHQARIDERIRDIQAYNVSNTSTVATLTTALTRLEKAVADLTTRLTPIETKSQRPLPMTRMEFDPETGDWLFRDTTGNRWRLTPTSDMTTPLLMKLLRP